MQGLSLPAGSCESCPASPFRTLYWALLLPCDLGSVQTLENTFQVCNFTPSCSHRRDPGLTLKVRDSAARHRELSPSLTITCSRI